MTAGVCVRSAVYSVGDKTIVNGVDLDVMPGEVVGVVGPNGAGKTTLCSLIAGDLRPDSGEVEICGHAVRETSTATLARLRSVLPQQTSLGFPFSVRDVAVMGRHPYIPSWRSPTPRDVELAEDALERVGVLELAERLYPTLSGGEQRRASLARVLAQDTPVVLLDEPTASLDVGHQEMVMSLCRRLAADGKAVFAVLHDLNLAGAYVDRVAVMSEGAMVAVGPAHETMYAELLSAVFDQPLIVIPHPQTGKPVVLMANGEATRSDSAEGLQAVDIIGKTQTH